MALIDNYLKKKDTFEVTTPKKLLIDSYVTKKTPIVATKPLEQKPSTLLDKIKNAGSGLLKFGARVGVEAANLVSSTVDFTADFLSNQIKSNLEKPVVGITGISTKPTPQQKDLATKWKSFYDTTGGVVTEKVKNFTENLRNTDYIKPSEEWQKASTKEKFTTRLPETILNIGPGVVSSLGLYAINPAVGFAASAGSTADEIKTIAVNSGKSEEKAELLGLGTGLLVGWLDKIVPDEVFSPQQKKAFTKSFAKKVFLTGIKEAGTEIAQEDVQLLAEATIREDITKDEVVIRNLMSGLGGLIGGVGVDTTVTFINNIRSGDIGGVDTKEEEIKKPEVKKPEVVENQAVVSEQKQQSEIKAEEEKITEKSIPDIKENKKTVQAELDSTEVVQPKPIKPAQTQQISEDQIKTTKDIKGVKTTLRQVSTQLDQAVAEAEGKSVVAQTQREGLNTKDIAQLKRIYANSKTFQEGDIETIRASKSGNLLNRVIENVREINPNMDEQEAFDFALGLPTKSDTKTTTPQITELRKKQKQLKSYLDLLKSRQSELNIKEDTELSKEWERALTAQEKLEKIVQVSSSQLPVGEGKTRVSGLQARLKGALKSASQEDIEALGLSTYNQSTEDVQLEKADEYVKNNPDEAIKVAMRQIEPPEGLLANSVFIALTEAGRLDTDLATKITSIASTRFGQEIEILKRIMKDNPVVMMQDIVQARIEAYEKKSGKRISEVRKTDRKNIEAEIKKPNKYDWNSFVDSIQC